MSNRVIKFRVVHKNEVIGYERLSEYGWEWMVLELNPDKGERWVRGTIVYSADIMRSQFTGLHDSKGVEIYQSDVIRFKRPYRETQTHTGDNIPNGSYTEPMEPAIEIIEAVVNFENGMFCVNGDPLHWVFNQYDEDSLKMAIAFRGRDVFDWSDPTDGELAYLLEKYKCKDLSELLKFINDVEVIRNLHQHPELLKD